MTGLEPAWRRAEADGGEGVCDCLDGVLAEGVDDGGFSGPAVFVHGGFSEEMACDGGFAAS